MLAVHAAWVFEHVWSLFIHAYQNPNAGLGALFMFSGDATGASGELQGALVHWCDLQLYRMLSSHHLLLLQVTSRTFAF
jgi:hypothetical protein